MYTERSDEKIIHAWEQHVAHMEAVHGIDLDEVAISLGNTSFTWRSFVRSLREDNHPDLRRVYVEGPRRYGKKKNEDPIIRLSRCRVPPCTSET